MINFIICEDNKEAREMYEKIISKIAMPHDFNYKVHSYEKYNTELKRTIEDKKDVKIYVLDLELPLKSGIEIAKQIRKSDWESVIIILTSHDELELRVLKEKLLILDFISKFENYEKRLTETVNMVLDNMKNKKVISFKSNKELHHIKLDNILYIYRDSIEEKTSIVTKDKEYKIRDSLSKIMDNLDERFYQTHRACYVNKDKISTVDFKNSIIYFENKKTTDYLSRNYKKGLREIL